ASRGQSGGLSRATKDCFQVFDATGWPWVVIETVGIGQTEIAIAGLADTVLVVVNPGWGDAVQANKAGLMEVADIFVINKADRAGTRQTRRDLEAMIMHMPDHLRRPAIVETVATTGDGVPDLLAAIQAHRAETIASGSAQARRAARLTANLLDAIKARWDKALKALREDQAFAGAVARLAAGESDIASEADRLAEALARQMTAD
ncbi:MAG: methylmalonyl Co-A mutase-associated GTPase MeaB, partial [Alphaproteobacteria bacterium]